MNVIQRLLLGRLTIDQFYLATTVFFKILYVGHIYIYIKHNFRYKV